MTFPKTWTPGLSCRRLPVAFGIQSTQWPWRSGSSGTLQGRHVPLPAHTLRSHPGMSPKPPCLNRAVAHASHALPARPHSRGQFPAAPPPRKHAHRARTSLLAPRVQSWSSSFPIRAPTSPPAPEAQPLASVMSSSLSQSWPPNARHEGPRNEPLPRAPSKRAVPIGHPGLSHTPVDPGRAGWGSPLYRWDS